MIGLLIWNFFTNKCILTLMGHNSSFNSLVEMSDGRIASCSDDETIIIWDFNNNECVLTLQGHESSINSLIELDDGLIASCSDDRTIKLWK